MVIKWPGLEPTIYRTRDRGFEPRSGQTKDYKIGICYFSAKHVAIRRKSKDCLARNQNNVFEWSDMSTRGLLFQWASTIKIQHSAYCKEKKYVHYNMVFYLEYTQFPNLYNNYGKCNW
jgi:hypothetical protein